jgi:5'-nucleotidase
MAYTKKLLDKYYPIEIDTHMSIEEKMPFMLEWYQQVHTRMLTETVTPDKIREAVAACPSILLREGMDKLIKACQDSTPPIPFIIMSAGLGNVIEEFFRQRLPFELTSSTYIHSNRLNFGADGQLESFSEPLLHMFNKNIGVLPDSCKPLLEGKTHCLLVGDGMGDLTMADGFDVECLKVGFLNEKVEEKLSQYQANWDVIATNDGPVPELCLRSVGVA